MSFMLQLHRTSLVIDLLDWAACRKAKPIFREFCVPVNQCMRGLYKRHPDHDQAMPLLVATLGILIYGQSCRTAVMEQYRPGSLQIMEGGNLHKHMNIDFMDTGIYHQHQCRLRKQVQQTFRHNGCASEQSQIN